MLESETIILKEGICTVPSIEKWLQDPFPGLFITVIEATATGLSQRVQMLRSADVRVSLFQSIALGLINCVDPDLPHETAAFKSQV